MAVQRICACDPVIGTLTGIRNFSYGDLVGAANLAKTPQPQIVQIMIMSTKEVTDPKPMQVKVSSAVAAENALTGWPLYSEDVVTIDRSDMDAFVVAGVTCFLSLARLTGSSGASNPQYAIWASVEA